MPPRGEGRGGRGTTGTASGASPANSEAPVPVMDELDSTTNEPSGAEIVAQEEGDEMGAVECSPAGPAVEQKEEVSCDAENTTPANGGMNGATQARLDDIKKRLANISSRQDISGESSWDAGKHENIYEGLLTVRQRLVQWSSKFADKNGDIPPRQPVNKVLPEKREDAHDFPSGFEKAADQKFCAESAVIPNNRLSEPRPDAEVSSGKAGVDHDRSQSRGVSNRGENTTPANGGMNGATPAHKLTTRNERYPYQVKLSPLPADYEVVALQRYIATAFKVYVPSIYTRAKGNVAYLCFDNEKDQLDLVKVANGYVFKRHQMLAEPFDPKTQTPLPENEVLPDEPEITYDEEMIADTLPLLHLQYAEQSRLKLQDAELMCNRLHRLLCQKNIKLAGWAEAMVDRNGGHLVKIEPLIQCPTVNGYRNKAKFRVGRSVSGEIAVGFGLNDNDSPVLGVEPNDRMLHCSDNMKLAAKLFRAWLVDGSREPYDKRRKTGTFEYLLVRVTPMGSLMLVVIASAVNHTPEEMDAIKADLKEYFCTGAGAQCNIYSLYLQLLQDITPIYPRDKLELLAGEPDYEEQICGLKFCISPFSILNLSPASSENIYNSVIELTQPTEDMVIVDACAGICGIAFTLANKVAKAYAIEPQEDNVRDAKKTRELNDIKNVEIIEGKCEDHLGVIFAAEKKRPIVVIIDPPRPGLPTTIMGLIRAQENVKHVVYVCSNTKTGMRNFLDLASRPGRDPSTKINYSGLPFLPKRCIPIDCTPYTPNTTVPILLERLDPGTFPAATRPVPGVILCDLPTWKSGKKVATFKGRVERKRPSGRARMYRKQMRGLAGKGGGDGGDMLSMPRGPRSRNDPNSFGNISHNFGNGAPRRARGLDPMEQAFKAGLQAGWQAAAAGPPPPPPAPYSNQGYGNPGFPWQSQYGGGAGFGGYGYGNGFGAGYGYGFGGYGGAYGHGGFGTDFTSDSYGGGGRGSGPGQAGGEGSQFMGRFSGGSGVGGSGGRGGPNKRAKR